jgi:hypothetical protein
LCQGNLYAFTISLLPLSAASSAAEKTFRTITPPALKKTEITYPFQRYITIDVRKYQESIISLSNLKSNKTGLKHNQTCTGKKVS